MGRAPCCDRANVKKGPWSPEEDAKLKEYIKTHGTGGNWIALPQKAGLKRCGKSCRLRWLNYLRPDIKHGDFSDEEDRVILNLFTSIGSRWSVIAAQLAGRTDNDIKNYWNTKLKKKFMEMAAASHKTHQHSSNTLSSEKFPILEPSSVISSPAAFNYYNTPTPPSIFTAYEQNESFSISSSLVNNRATCFSNLSSPPSGLETYNQNIHSMNQFQENFMRFGGEASSSSSDGSSSEQDHFGTVSNVLDVDLQGYFCSYQKNYGFYGQNPLDYNLDEEMKQLISTNLDLQQQHLG